MKKILNIYLEIDVTLILFLKSRISRISGGGGGWGIYLVSLFLRRNSVFEPWGFRNFIFVNNCGL